ncbi:MAG: hypothetical protein F6K22_19330 [Okeania sp. SIO2F4]|uniref:hypothetical protein n=1 Tax=Okeania sp. SIO2F4 TaxID=2607790 RepID=UPI00142BD94A|nr:hypothetical protein [Okeania sp. SIO2F4]NES04795.1 hypothetical protein [Okeania sp. SIO2F4]
MLDTLLASKASEIVLYGLDKVTGGSLEAIAGEVIKSLKSKLQGIFNLDRARENQELLKAAILNLITEDKSFRNNLEQQVLRFQKEENNTINVTQNAQDRSFNFNNLTAETNTNIAADTNIGQQHNYFRNE